MHEADALLKAIAVVLCVAAVTTVAFQRLRQPVVLGYILAGLIIGPYVPIPLAADHATIETLSELGVILLMFSLGLEFSLSKLFRVGLTAGLTALIQSSLMLWIGFMVGRAFGWTSHECIFAGAIIAISSTTIIAKAFDEQNIRGKLRDLVVGILIVEDLIAIVLMAVLTALASGDHLSGGVMVKSTGRLALFLVALLVVGLMIIPRTVRAINRLQRKETTLVANIGICFSIALLAKFFGYSVALGAFIAGSLVAESGEERRIEVLIAPVRDMFAAIFFVSVGMLIDPAIILKHWDSILVLTLVVIGGKFFGVSLGAFFTGNSVRRSVEAGMSLAQIGEFSFIIASLGVSLKATGDFLLPVAIAVSAITTLTTPWLIRASAPLANFIDRKLPRPLQTFAALYGTWLEQLKASSSRKSVASTIRRLLRLLLIDAVILAVIAVVVVIYLDRISDFASQKLGIPPDAARLAVTLTAALLAAPFVFGVYQISRRLGIALAQAALNVAVPGELDLAAAPRRALVVTIQMAILLGTSLPILALTQPFLPGIASVPVLGGFLIILGLVFWRSATNLEGHVKAGAEIIIEALTTQPEKSSETKNQEALERIGRLLPGIGEPVTYRIESNNGANGKKLSQLNLRGATGASVLAIARADKSVIVPQAGEILRAGDILVLAGTRDAISTAVNIVKNFSDKPE